jgi:superfamily II DNA or RNA helicase/predicted RNA methylase
MAQQNKLGKSTVVMKRSSITNALLEQEENIFVSKNTSTKGLAQYYTPLKIAAFMRDVIGLQSGCVMDLTAGCGNLLAPFSVDPDIMAVGVELDKSNIPKKTPECEIHNANLVELYPYLLKVEFQANAMVLNPPFSLFWTVPELTGTDEKKIESQLATILMAENLLTHSGHGAFVAEKSTWLNSISLKEEIKDHVYLVVTAKNMFLPHSKIECVICFFTGHSDGIEPEQYEIDMDAPGIDKQLESALRLAKSVRRDHGLYPSEFVNEETKLDNVNRFRAAVAEYKVKKNAKKQVFNIDYVAGKLSLYISNFAQYRIEQDYDYAEKQLIEEMRGVSPSYFAFNTQARRQLFAMLENKNVLTISPAAKAAIDKAVVDADFILTPLYPLKPQQRLGYLEDIEKILCTKSFVHRPDEYRQKVLFEKGTMYDVKVSTTTFQEHYDKVSGGGEPKEMVKVGKALVVDIGGVQFSEDGKDIQVIVDHFQIPDPKDVRHKKPELYERIKKRLESDEFKLFTWRDFQIEDLTRAAMKCSCILSWAMGLGKSRGAFGWAILRNARKTLIIIPQDLKKQWFEEAATLNIKLEEITSYTDILRIKQADSGFFLIHYELLKGGRRYDEYVDGFESGVAIVKDKDGNDDVITFGALCPACNSTRGDGWNGKSCRKCGYHVWTKRKKPLYSYLKHSFDTIIVDEGVKIKSKYSLQGMSVRALHADNRLLLSGSPIKGWITDAYWLLHWVLGNASPRFPYHYLGGTEKFLGDFGVFEYVAEEFRKTLSSGKKKLLPEIGNLHLLWKLFAPSIIRRTKEECGEVLVEKNIHRIKVNFTVEQKKVYDWWIDNFTDWYKNSHVTQMEDTGIEMKKMILGLLWKLRFSATAPASRLLPGEAGPGMEKTFYPGAVAKTNVTEKALFVISKVKEHVERGEQVVIFSSLQDNMHFLWTLLNRYGFKAEIANAETGPKKRGLLIHDFKQKRFSVLIAGTQAVNLGHSLDCASAVIMTDYEWDHSTTRQAIDRVHRLTSKKDVNVYMLYTEGGVDRKQLYEIIDRKGQSSDLALDGKLLENKDVNVDFFKIARELIHEHKHGVEGLLNEVDIERKITELIYKNVAQVVGEELVIGDSKPLSLKSLTGETKMRIKARIVSRNQIDLFV